MFLALGLTVLLNQFILTPTYGASTSFTISPNAEQDYRQSSELTTTQTEQFTTSFAAVLSSSALAKLVAEELQQSVEDFQVSVSNVSDTNVFTLAVTSANPEKSLQILTAYLSLYPQIADAVTGSVALDIISSASLPTQPNNRHWQFLSLLICVGLFIFIEIVFSQFYLGQRQKIHDRQDLEQFLGLPEYGTLPLVAEKKRRGRTPPLWFSHSIPEYYQEAVRQLRLRLEKNYPQKGTSICFTSTCEKEGKTTAVINLAMSLAEVGQKVLLINGDVANHSFNKYLHLDAISTSYESLLANQPVEPLIKKQFYYDLDVLPIGEDSEKAQQFIEAGGFKELLAELKSSYDFILIDSAACLKLQDSQLISKECEACLLVVKQDLVSAQEIIRGLRNFSNSNVAVSGVVLNMTHNEIFSNYSQYYGYGN